MPNKQLRALVFVHNTHNAHLFEFGLRERHAMFTEITQPEATIYRRCEKAGHKLEKEAKRAANRNVAPRPPRVRTKPQPRVFIEA